MIIITCTHTYILLCAGNIIKFTIIIVVDGGGGAVDPQLSSGIGEIAPFRAGQWGQMSICASERGDPGRRASPDPVRRSECPRVPAAPTPPPSLRARSVRIIKEILTRK